MRGFRSALGSLEFTEIVTPKLVGTATESGANVFTVDYFGQPAYLAQSPQLYKQMLVGVFERVFEVGPVFRAEPHDTVRHLAQYTSLDAELGFIRDHRDVLAVLRAALFGMVQSIRTYAAEAASLLGVDLCRRSSRSSTSATRWRWWVDPDEPDLSPAHERAQRVGASRVRLGLPCGGGLSDGQATLLHAPEGYEWTVPPAGLGTHGRRSAPWVVRNSFDLLFRGLELTTGGQRAASSERLRRRPPARRAVARGARGIPRRVPARDAAPRRVRDRARALGGPPDRRREHPRGHPLPPGPDPSP